MWMGIWTGGLAVRMGFSIAGGIFPLIRSHRVIFVVLSKLFLTHKAGNPQRYRTSNSKKQNVETK